MTTEIATLFGLSHLYLPKSVTLVHRMREQRREMNAKCPNDKTIEYLLLLISLLLLCPSLPRIQSLSDLCCQVQDPSWHRWNFCSVSCFQMSEQECRLLVRFPKHKTLKLTLRTFLTHWQFHLWSLVARGYKKSKKSSIFNPYCYG